MGFIFAAGSGIAKPFLQAIKTAWFGETSGSIKNKKAVSETTVTQIKVETTLDKNANAMVFVMLYAIVTYYFSNKMNRLMLLMGPISAVLTGIALVRSFSLLGFCNSCIIYYIRRI